MLSAGCDVGQLSKVCLVESREGSASSSHGSQLILVSGAEQDFKISPGEKQHQLLRGKEFHESM